MKVKTKSAIIIGDRIIGAGETVEIPDDVDPAVLAVVDILEGKAAAPAKNKMRPPVKNK